MKKTVLCTCISIFENLAIFLLNRKDSSICKVLTYTGRYFWLIKFQFNGPPYVVVFNFVNDLSVILFYCIFLFFPFYDSCTS